MTTTATLTLSAFLTARLAEEERRASYAHGPGLHLSSCVYTAKDWLCDCGLSARVLAGVEAHRRIVKAAAKAQAYLDEGENGYADYAIAHTWSMKVLASVYAGHEDYRAEWAL